MMKWKHKHSYAILISLIIGLTILVIGKQREVNELESLLLDCIEVMNMIKPNVSDEHTEWVDTIDIPVPVVSDTLFKLDNDTLPFRVYLILKD